MERRKYLTSVALATSLGLAGCGGTESGGNGTTAGGEGEATTTASGEEATTTAADGATTTASAEDGGEEATTAGDEDGSGEVTTTAEGEDGGGSGEDGATTTASSGEGEETTTAAATESSSGDSGESASISDSGDTDVSIREASVDDGLSLDSATFYLEDGGFSAGVRGEVTNTSDSSIGYMEVNTLFYDSDGNRLGDGLDNLNEFQAGETYKYDALYFGTNDASEIASYNIEVTQGF